jgi:hypothetical protein
VRFIPALRDALAVLRLEETVHLSGQWVSRQRRTYRTQSQLGSGQGPYADAVDHAWKAAVSAPLPIVGIGFLVRGTEVYWAKSPPPTTPLELVVSVTAYAEFTHDRATVSMSLGGSVLPGIPTRWDGATTALPVPPATCRACTVIPITSAPPAEFFAVFFPARLVRVGRNRLWRLREEHAQLLPEHVRTLLTRRRTGRVAG